MLVSCEAPRRCLRAKVQLEAFCFFQWSSLCLGASRRGGKGDTTMKTSLF